MSDLTVETDTGTYTRPDRLTWIPDAIYIRLVHWLEGFGAQLDRWEARSEIKRFRKQLGIISPAILNPWWARRRARELVQKHAQYMTDWEREKFKALGGIEEAP